MESFGGGGDPGPCVTSQKVRHVVLREQFIELGAFGLKSGAVLGIAGMRGVWATGYAVGRGVGRAVRE